MIHEPVAISVILPCYNEKENILALIAAIHAQLQDKSHEIVVVDDNSPDGTYALVKNAGLPYVKALKRETSPSLALSIRHGIEHSNGAFVVVMDSDFNHRPEYLPILVENLKYYDCVSVSRFVYGGDMGNRFRHICSWLFNIGTRILTRTFVTDSLFGYFAIHRHVLNQIDFDKVFWGYGDYCIRLMVYLQKRNSSILQIPGVLGQRLGGQGNSRLIRTLLQYSMEVIKLVFFVGENEDAGRVTRIRACRVCGNTHLVETLDLGEQALTGVFPASPGQHVTSGPLKLVKCHGEGDDICHLLQLQHTYDLGELYGDNYGYRSGLNASMVRHLESKVQKILQRAPLQPGDLVLDIGSNDGTTLGFYPQGAWDVIGMDPTGRKFAQYYKPHVKLISDFFSAQKLREKMGDRKAKVVTSFSMFYDLENPVAFAQEVADILATDGIWVLEQSYMPEMLRQISYDTVCHEHLEYYGLAQIAFIAEKVGLKILDVEFNDINGGSFSIACALKASPHQADTEKLQRILQGEQQFRQLAPYEEFASAVAQSKRALLAKLRQLKKSGAKIYGMGASTKGNVILQYCGITPDLLPKVGEVNEEKYGKYTPGTCIPIVSETEILRENPDYVLVLPWHFRSFFESSPKFQNTKLLYPLSIDEASAQTQSLRRTGS
jgi:NDP-4-keto-2,6-dideoxyhexose 3-C-methyltransferase